MIYKPVLAKCADRSITAKNHPTSGKPEDWLANKILSDYKVSGISFDFFVNWSNNTISHEIWIKRIVDKETKEWPINNKELLQKWIYDCDSDKTILDLCKFCDNYSLTLNYFLYKESNWENKGEIILNIMFNNKGSISEIKKVYIDELKERIKNLSGGPIIIGKKGLIYGLSNLECYLSKTDALWPGDVDLLLIDENLEPLSIIEFKKHNLDVPIKNQKISNYYPYPNGKKYNRLLILKDFLKKDKEIPFVVLYYPTKTNENLVKLEKITGKINSLTSNKPMILKLPEKNNERSIKEFIESLIKLIFSNGDDNNERIS